MLALLVSLVAVAAQYLAPAEAHAQALEIPTTNLQVWLRADAIEGLSDGDPVVTWIDQSGNSNDANQARRRNQPSYRASGLNEMPTVLFDGLDDYLQITSNPDLEPQSLSAFVVVLPTTAGGGTQGRDLFGKYYGPNEPYASYAIELIGDPRFEAHDRYRMSGAYGGEFQDETTDTFDSTRWVALGQADILSGIWDANPSTSLFVDGTDWMTSNVTGSIDYNGGPLTIGKWLGSNSANDAFGGEIAEFLLYDTALSTSDRQLVEGSLAWKYRLQEQLPTDHPYRTEMPGSVLDGDYDGSGMVEQADLDLVLLNWGGTTPPVPAGWDDNLPNGVIDQEELDKVLLNWGSAASEGLATAAIPEPGGMVLGLLALSVALIPSKRSALRR